MTQPTDIPTQLAAIKARMDEIRSSLGEQGLPDVSDLHPQIASLCASIDQMDPAIAKTYADQMQTLNAELGEIAAEFKRIMAISSSEMQRISTTTAATTAYAKSGAQLPPARKEGEE